MTLQEVIGGKLVQLPVPPCGLGVATTVYPVMGLPPLNWGGDQETVAAPIPAVAVTFVGASDRVKGKMG